jgi:hypothetical protein
VLPNQFAGHLMTHRSDLIESPKVRNVPGTTYCHCASSALLVLSLTLSLSEIRLLGAEPMQSKAGILAIEAGIVKSRRDLHSGRVVIRLHENTFARSPAGTRVDRRYTVYFKGNKWRADLERLDLSSGASIPLSKIVWTNDHYIRDLANDQVVQLFGSKNEAANGA